MDEREIKQIVDETMSEIIDDLSQSSVEIAKAFTTKLGTELASLQLRIALLEAALDSHGIGRFDVDEAYSFLQKKQQERT